MGHIEAMGVGYVLPDGRELFAGVSFRVGDGAKVALVGPNGAGKTTLLRMVAGDLAPASGSIARSGGLGVMGQFVGSISDGRTLADLALSLAPPAVRAAGERLRSAERALDDTERTQLRYAAALAMWGDAGGYGAEVECDTASVAALGLPWERTRDRPVATLSGGEQKRFALELLFRGPDEVLLLDEPDNFLDVPGKRRLEARIADSAKSVLFVSHDRELLANTAQRVVTVEAGSAWTHPGGFASWHAARVARHDRLDEHRRRWDEEREKLERLVTFYKVKAASNDGMASRLQAARTRLARFLDAGAPAEKAQEQSITMRLGGGRTGKRALVCSGLELDDLTFPFDLEVWFGDRVAVLGANGTGKSHFLRLLARGGTDPEPGAVPASGAALAPVAHDGAARLGARVRPGHFSQTHDRPELTGAALVDALVRGDVDRAGMPLGGAMKALARYELAEQGEQRFETLSGGQQARFLILLLELSGATLLLLDEPTDNLDLASAEALEQALAAFEGTVLAVTHDRWFTRGFDRFLLFGGDGEVRETPEPVWDVSS
ncbi:ABC-F family ATP-binding cassette domain-containing protein [Pseudonocardia abyssalis]|uniref:ABC-F family ATP-binding cassette domain-containing protein n=1 Tax=Pseudonocardia abyssalis TaxID=2792008 RepID=A0ABS6UT54_9PSEU|nr:ATP-binding cassette domain-containing protein [Pseudonocardia abyssalis]MBW0114599.1 ABC-F family ATP-binding cassette domain-containing protein [Pseudonocardia abyssalis]MBW0135442.1 ABC-F family ATP-binding cassette domain-containing protein [Pseudonocardia abyssalis]